MNAVSVAVEVEAHCRTRANSCMFKRESGLYYFNLTYGGFSTTSGRSTPKQRSEGNGQRKYLINGVRRVEESGDLTNGVRGNR